MLKLKMFLKVFAIYYLIINHVRPQQIYQRYSDGSYKYAYQTDNGIEVEQNGHLTDESVIIVDGYYKYRSPDGKIFELNYKADLNGFQPQSKRSITTPPPQQKRKRIDLNDIEQAKRYYHIPSVLLPLQQVTLPENY